MKITHVGISHFRSIGECPVMVDLSKKITILVGQNDCGKSNVLKATEWFSKLRNANEWKDPSEIDRHKRSPMLPVLHVIGQLESADITAIQVKFVSEVSKDLSGSKSCPELETDDIELFNDMMKLLGQQVIAPQNFRRPDAKEVFKSRALTTIAKGFQQLLPTAHIVLQYRRIDDTEKYSIEGKGIIKLLSLWQHPEIGQDANRKRFDRVEKLLRDLLERPHITLEVPHTHKEILVRDGDMRLPLESHGTGIHQLIILAIAVLSEDNVIFGIEEPEVHLHPVLQRRFLKFLKEETTNRYLITTHSPTLIAPAEDVDVIHLKMVDGVTIPIQVATDTHTLEALADLGIHPSDLLQANCVVWVEGPSDRIYLNHWLKLLAPDLTEGIEYAVMFYGGRLLAHLSMEREQAELDLPQLINVLRINQHSAMMIDSDRKIGPKDTINSTKQRIADECTKNGLHVWITDGREIENYLPARTVEATLQSEDLLKGRFALAAHDGIGDALNAAMVENPPRWTQYNEHKPEWAHRFCKHLEKSDIDDKLLERMNALIAFIKRRQPAT